MQYHIKKMQDSADLKGNDFVGLLEDENYSLQISVPYGVNIPDIVDRKDLQNARFLKRYVKVIQKALNSARVKRALESDVRGLRNPISGTKVVCDYVIMGPLIEYFEEKHISTTGKIDFNRTIKKIMPHYVNGEFVYEKYIVLKKKILEDNFVAQVQENVINHFMENGGDIIFGTKIKIPTKSISLNRKTIMLLRRELNQTFNSRKQTIIRWMIEYIEGIDITEQNGKWEYAIIASTLWETMVNAVFGNQVKLDKSLYGKRYSMYSLKSGTKVKQGKPTEHDTIFEDNESVFIIDAKMYGSEDNLLSEEVLGKQFGYYIEAKVKRPNKMVVNILFMPAAIGEANGFSENVIIDPHTDLKNDPDKLIFVYKYSTNKMIEDYYFSRKRIGQIKKEFIDFIKVPYVEAFLRKSNPRESRIYSYATKLSKIRSV